MTPKTAKAFFERIHREIERDDARTGARTDSAAFEVGLPGVGRFAVSFIRELAK